MRTSKRFAVAAAVAVLLSAAEAIPAAKSDEKDVLAAVQLLLDGWRDADAAKVDRALHKDFREVTLHLQDGRWNFAAVDRATLVGLMGRIEKNAWDDRLLKPQVHVDGPMAVVWSRYRFTVRYVEGGANRAADHCGVETFQLYRDADAWKIVNFADTHTDDCPP